MTNLPKSLIKRISFPTDGPLGDVIWPLVRSYTSRSIAELRIQPANRSTYTSSWSTVPRSPLLPRRYRILRIVPALSSILIDLSTRNET